MWSATVGLSIPNSVALSRPPCGEPLRRWRKSRAPVIVQFSAHSYYTIPSHSFCNAPGTILQRITKGPRPYELCHDHGVRVNEL